jgi:hypothetical protein
MKQTSLYDKYFISILQNWAAGIQGVSFADGDPG